MSGSGCTIPCGASGGKKLGKFRRRVSRHDFFRASTSIEKCRVKSAQPGLRCRVVGKFQPALMLDRLELEIELRGCDVTRQTIRDAERVEAAIGEGQELSADGHAIHLENDCKGNLILRVEKTIAFPGA